MISTLSWIDYDSAAHQRAQRILTLFKERDTRDELGLGAIRDAIADTLFPGTSTIQTRLRYMLFLPWIFQGLEEKGVRSPRITKRARSAQIALAAALAENTSHGFGIIGVAAGKGLKRLPSSVYWAGLGTWGIRLYPGTEGQYHRGIDHIYARRRSARSKRSEVSEVGDDVGGLWEQGFYTWHPGMPEVPDNFPESSTFNLTRDEVQYLQERILHTKGGSLLSDLMAHPIWIKAPVPWEHPHIADFRPEHQSLLRHAHNFALVAQGAAILYNQMLASKRGDELLFEEHRESGHDWLRKLNDRTGELTGWFKDIEQFWSLVSDRGHQIGPQTMRFVESWVETLLRESHSVFDRSDAQNLVRYREIEKKRANSRFTNQRVLDQWGGKSGLGLMTFRWPIAQSYIKDMARALRR